MKPCILGSEDGTGGPGHSRPGRSERLNDRREKGEGHEVGVQKKNGECPRKNGISES